MVESKWLYTTRPVLNCTTHRNIPLACLMNMYLESNEQHNTISLAIDCASPSAQTSTLCGVKLVRDAVYYFGESKNMPFGLMTIVPHPLCMLPNVISAKWWGGKRVQKLLCNLFTWEQQDLTGALCHMNIKGHTNNILATSTPFNGCTM